MKRMIGFIFFWIAIGMTIMFFVTNGYDLYKNQCHYRVENDKTLDELVNTIITIINNE